MDADTRAVRVLSVRDVGSRALLAELAGTPEVLALTEALRKAPLPGQEQVIPASATVLITAWSAPAARNLRKTLLELEVPPAVGKATGAEVVINTVYDGDDLARVADLTGKSVDAVIAAHAGQPWTAAFGGFAPGFVYLAGKGDFEVPRLDSPRTAVPAGSVGLAGNFSAVYPRTSPGGWQLIGRTDAVMWDLGREFPALVRPGDTVRFQPVRQLVRMRRRPLAAPSAAQDDTGGQPGLRVVRPGALSLIEDLGRSGYEELGVSGSGALDRAALRRANRLVGNNAGAACIETVAGGLAVQAVGDHIVAVAGAPASLRVHPGGSWTNGADAELRSVPAAEPLVLLDGEVLQLGPSPRGFRSYVAVRGGIDVQPVLGSRSTDTLSGMGPAPLTEGQLLPVGSYTASGVVGHPESQPRYPGAGDTTELRVVPGPRADWFVDGSLELLCARTWAVSPRSNRVGLRLSGQPLARLSGTELPSEGMVPGALQVPPDGQPVLFLADHPVTGGYPVIAVVAEEDLGLAAQIPLGSNIRFRLY